MSTARRLFQDDDAAAGSGGVDDDDDGVRSNGVSNSNSAAPRANAADAPRAASTATATPTLISAAKALEALEYSPIKGVVNAPASPGATTVPTTPASPPARRRVVDDDGVVHARNLSFEFFTDDEDESSFASATEASMLENATSELTFQSARGRTLAYDDESDDDDDGGGVVESKRGATPAWVKPTVVVIGATLGVLAWSKSKPKSKSKPSTARASSVAA